MAQLCTNAPPITNSALNGSHLHQCLLTHSECTEPTQIKCSPYTLRVHSTNSNQVLSLHTQNALNQLKSSALWIKCGQVHLNDSNQDLQCWNVHTCTSNASKYLQRAPIQHLYTSKLKMASKTSKLFKTPRLQKRLQEPSRTETCTSNKHKTSRSLFMDTSNQTSNHATYMSGPITCWKQ